MSEDSSIERHLRAGREQRVRIGEAVNAFRRLTPADYGHFLATIEVDLGAGAPALLGEGASPLLLASPAEEPSPPPTAPSPGGSLREAVVALLSNGGARSTMEIRRDLEAHRPINRASLNSEIFTMRKLKLLRSEGKGRGTRHALVSRPTATTRAPAGKREPATRAAKRKRDDDEDRPAPSGRGVRQGPVLSAEQLYAAAIGDHHLLNRGEELALARQLEELEISLWERLLGGPLAPKARQRLLELDPPVEPTSAREARNADIDRLIAAHVIASADPSGEQLADEIAALRAITTEADRIRDHFASCNLRLVPSTIHRHGYHRTTSLAMGDLIQEGNLGLLKAIPRFDYRRGLRFSTFATWWIRHYLVRARQNLGTEVRVPVHLQELAGKVRRAKVQLRRELGRDPTQTEIAGALKVSKKSLQTLNGDWLKYREALPVFDSVGEDGSMPAYLASDDALADEILSRRQEDDQVVDAIDRLPPLLARIVRRRFGLGGDTPETLIQIGESMKLSRERIRQLEKKALSILRQALVEVTVVAA